MGIFNKWVTQFESRSGCRLKVLRWSLRIYSGIFLVLSDAQEVMWCLFLGGFEWIEEEHIMSPSTSFSMFVLDPEDSKETRLR